MDLSKIVQTGENEYWVATLQDLVTLSFFAYIGTRAYCDANEKIYILVGPSEWVSI